MHLYCSASRNESLYEARLVFMSIQPWPCFYVKTACFGTPPRFHMVLSKQIVKIICFCKTLSTWYFRLQISYVGFQISDFTFQTSNFRLGQVTVKRSGVPALIHTLDPQKNPWLVARMRSKHRIDSVPVLWGTGSGVSQHFFNWVSQKSCLGSFAVRV